jgi:hypothetical protein
MIVIQPIGTNLAKNGHRWLQKVNAEKKIGVAVLFFGVLKKPRKGTKYGLKTCTKPWCVCKNLAFPPQFTI